ncbi:uncharacterized protein EDB91DRAFT_285621 [Suillus paluster]|uniref:uncharacterized protein n=1 Tax=Suillus paluster TaxID=48578 RepID=UPI001B862D50|nr:uncharacterized protein EDB91DRAFT_285621 [Suillus paluster]KAG1755294.1 hypothetical protein EDB91DRAFT_285621 [Suillus paluster]
MESLSPIDQMLEVFDSAPPHKHLHIVVQAQGPPTPAGSSGPLHLNCIVLGDDQSRIFEIKIEPTESVSALQKVIKDAKKHAFHDVDADSLTLWKVNLPVNETLKDCLDNLTPEQFLSPVTKLLKVFKHQPDEEHLHIVVQPPHTVPVVPYIPVVDRRVAYLQKGADTPSVGARPVAFAATQEEQEYLCSRPRSAADSLPVTLLEPIFAEFVDDCQNYQPTVNDNAFVWQLLEKMPSFYPDELTRMKVFRQLLREYDIILDASMVRSTKCITDGHLLSRDEKFVQVILEGKNEIGGDGAKPFAEAMLYYRKFMEKEMGRLRSVIPCIYVIVFGACVGFAGSVFAEKVQCDVLGPIIPLFCHKTDIPMQVMAARTFGALKIATEKLTKLYSQPIPRLEAEDIGCPYPRSYTCSSGQIQEFSYDETQMFRDRLIFFGETVGDAARKKICIKFVRYYCREAYNFCASKGHAPELIAYKPLAGGWNMVIMDALDIDDGRSMQRPGLYRPLSAILDRQPLKETITSLIEELHKQGYVHGDVRDTNLFARDNEDFMLLDFDWAGPIQEARYPMYVDRQDIRRPDGARDGEKIMAEHDMDMLKYIFRTEEDGRETAAKRRRISTTGRYSFL